MCYYKFRISAHAIVASLCIHYFWFRPWLEDTFTSTTLFVMLPLFSNRSICCPSQPLVLYTFLTFPVPSNFKKEQGPYTNLLELFDSDIPAAITKQTSISFLEIRHGSHAHCATLRLIINTNNIF